MTKTRGISRLKAATKGKRGPAKPTAAAKTKPKTKPKAKTKATKATGKPSKQTVKTRASTGTRSLVRPKVLEIYRAYYGTDQSDDEILAVDPNGYDLDPGPFYEMLQSEFGSAITDPQDSYFEGLGGTVAQIIDKIVARWSGPDGDGDGGGHDDDVGAANGHYPMLDYYLNNVGRKPRDADFKTALNMFKFELRSDYKALKEEAKQVLEKRQFDEVAELARKLKVRIDASAVEAMLQRIVAH